jgi:hypothetical protein
MREIITKLKTKKGKMDLDLKVCKSCNQEFNEKQNFNWSCRTHHYAFSGEIWWCCGKRGQNEPGCKFAKH